MKKYKPTYKNTPWGESEVMMTMDFGTGKTEVKMPKKRYEKLLGKIKE